MENENQCFFSISLENGIVITGNNQNEVLCFLTDMHIAFYELADHYENRQLTDLTKKTEKIFWYIDNAIKTITKT